MSRSILSVIGGFVLWTVLWLSSNGTLTAIMPRQFRADGSTENSVILALMLAMSVVFSIAAGYVAVLIARRSEMRHAWALGILQLVVGIFVQSQYWSVMPVWYHVIFLALLLPGILAGAKLRASRSPSAVPA